MEQAIDAVPVERKFEVVVIYNGVKKSLEARPTETVRQLLDRAIHAFGITQQPHLLSLYTSDGRELTNEAQTLADAGVKSHDQLLLRPGAVKGG